ncbi:MAG: hypothetical protein Q4D17_10315, partial [Planctomycetia bacterium]|nr:hypothetical protein [Planctomycetia bacterium]
KKVTFPSSLKVIMEAAFIANRDIHEVELPENLESVGPKAFGYGKSGLVVTVLGMETKFDALAFEGTFGVRIRAKKQSKALDYARARGFDFEILE